MVGVAEDRGENTQRGRVGEEGTHRNSGGLHWRKIWGVKSVNMETLFRIFKRDESYLQCRVVILADGWMIWRLFSKWKDRYVAPKQGIWRGKVALKIAVGSIELGKDMR